MERAIKARVLTLHILPKQGYDTNPLWSACSALEEYCQRVKWAIKIPLKASVCQPTGIGIGKAMHMGILGLMALGVEAML